MLIVLVSNSRLHLTIRLVVAIDCITLCHSPHAIPESDASVHKTKDQKTFISLLQSETAHKSRSMHHKIAFTQHSMRFSRQIIFLEFIYYRSLQSNHNSKPYWNDFIGLFSWVTQLSVLNSWKSVLWLKALQLSYFKEQFPIVLHKVFHPRTNNSFIVFSYDSQSSAHETTRIIKDFSFPSLFKHPRLLFTINPV